MSDSQPYRVLARKYRSRTFAELIGQEAMVQTLANAIKRDRLAHAFLLTGVRGVGKTSTARILAKALNCVGPDGKGGPTIDPCGVCEPCMAIAEGRHIDVIEMDAASNTGVDDVREIIEAVRYAAVSARYKVYIVDEVHMLSRNAFNALLKTLEEPPPHVKFIFATTEVQKVPVTVLSRCQRFDLRRIPADMLAAHFARVTEAEKVRAEPAALALIAEAAEGSARDGLSILDQAIAYAEMAEEGTAEPLITAVQVRAMLGLSDRAAVRRLMEHLLEARSADLLDAVREQHALGVEPLALVRGLMELTHAIMLDKLGKGVADAARSAEEQEALGAWSARLSFAELHRLWQLLLKAHAEVGAAALPIETAEMALLRCVHAAGLPDPGEIAQLLRQGGSEPRAAAPQPGAGAGGSPQAETSTMTAPATFAALVDIVRDKYPLIGLSLHDDVELVRYAPPELIIRPTRVHDSNFIREIGARLGETTGMRWTVSIGDGPAEPSLRAQEMAAEEAVRAATMDAPLVKAAMAAFPDAELIGNSPQ